MRDNNKPDISVDVSEAGEGELLVIIMDSKGTIQSALEEGKDEKLWVTFEPTDYDLYDVYMTFNGEPIPGEECLYYSSTIKVIFTRLCFQTNQFRYYSNAFSPPSCIIFSMFSTVNRCEHSFSVGLF